MPDWSNPNPSWLQGPKGVAAFAASAAVAQGIAQHQLSVEKMKNDVLFDNTRLAHEAIKMDLDRQRLIKEQELLEPTLRKAQLDLEVAQTKKENDLNDAAEWNKVWLARQKGEEYTANFKNPENFARYNTMKNQEDMRRIQEENNQTRAMLTLQQQQLENSFKSLQIQMQQSVLDERAANHATVNSLNQQIFELRQSKQAATMDPARQTIMESEVRQVSDLLKTKKITPRDAVIRMNQIKDKYGLSADKEDVPAEPGNWFQQNWPGIFGGGQTKTPDKNSKAALEWKDGKFLGDGEDE